MFIVFCVVAVFATPLLNLPTLEPEGERNPEETEQAIDQMKKRAKEVGSVDPEPPPVSPA
ncbi:MAG: hypothetical protein OEZ14_05700 [Acidimicrobiia bacterium]|nr:hypothetical protein [Acidimicrobiia bacterium]MDH5520011.1 hypothetical protein [Acidimicrobiia bacterium]